jgi:hypothetical protein
MEKYTEKQALGKFSVIINISLAKVRKIVLCPLDFVVSLSFATF